MPWIIVRHTTIVFAELLSLESPSSVFYRCSLSSRHISVFSLPLLYCSHALLLLSCSLTLALSSCSESSTLSLLYSPAALLPLRSCILPLLSYSLYLTLSCCFLALLLLHSPTLLHSHSLTLSLSCSTALFTIQWILARTLSPEQFDFKMHRLCSSRGKLSHKEMRQ